VQYFSVEELLLLHFKIIQDYGGSHGVRDEGRIKSVVSVPQQDVFNQPQYLSIFEKAAVYLRNIIADHPFVGGNKRTAVTVATIFLTRNSQSLTATPKELEDFAVQAAVEHFDTPTIATWLNNHSCKV
jgi:death-on-curing protein